MTSSDDRLRNLAERVGSLLVEPTAPEELERLFAGADVRLRHAKVASLSSALARYHDRRNRMIYEGLLVATQAEADDLVRLVSELRGLVAKALRSPG